MLLPALAACAHLETRTVGIAAPECAALGPLTYSQFDTDETIRQIKALDAAWRSLCAPGKAAGR
jgi:hypothetical protein